MCYIVLIPLCPLSSFFSNLLQEIALPISDCILVAHLFIVYEQKCNKILILKVYKYYQNEYSIYHKIIFFKVRTSKKFHSFFEKSNVMNKNIYHII